ncbi:MAG: GNAT family N-acetyltransferase [Anaerolineae bacterium]|nr:GNAT family N-acetyltransferase [Anaerolineae bacterium]
MIREKYPYTITIHDKPFTLRLMTAQDRDVILYFAQHLPETDLSFMRRDITQPEAVDAWIRDVQSNRAVTILVEDQGNMVGYGTLYFNQLFWNRHLAEVRVLISSTHRNWGLGTRLMRDLTQFAQELKLDKVIVYMAVENDSARRMTTDLGFKAEAILADWVKTRDNRTHDLLIMSMALSEMHN